MTVDEIRIQAQLDCGLQINSATALVWVKEAIADICSNYYLAGKHIEENVAPTIDTMAPQGATYPYYKVLASPLLKLINITDVDNNNPLSDSDYMYDRGDNSIRFKNKGIYMITYWAIPSMPQTTSEEVSLPHLFEDCIKYYLAHKIRARLFGQNDANAYSYYEKYRTGKASAETATLKQDKKRRIPWGRGI